MNDIIRFEQVTKAYGDQVILKAFDLKIRKGEFLTVIGSSGSGKTTMLKLINGLSAPTQGKIYIDGKVSFTSRMYPKYEDSDYLSFFAEGCVLSVSDLTIYRLGSAYSDTVTPAYYGNTGSIKDA